MEQMKMDELVAKYNEGLADPMELQQLERLLEEGQIDLTQLRDLKKLDEQFTRIEPPQTSLQMDDRFYAMLASAKRKQRGSFSFAMPEWSWLAPRLAFTIVVLTAGFTVGYFMEGPKEKIEVATLTKEVSELKEMMMLSLLEKESATDRLKAVSLSTEMDQVSQKVALALIQTLNNDANVNVRLAALDALRPFSRQSKVREDLIRSISKQESPLVQVALAELMVELQEKKSLREFEKIIQSDKTPADIKTRIRESLSVLI